MDEQYPRHEYSAHCEDARLFLKLGLLLYWQAVQYMEVLLCSTPIKREDSYAGNVKLSDL